MTGNALLDLLILAVPAALARLWWTGMRAHELAVAHARRACQGRGLQFLDQTVARQRLKLMRLGAGSVGFRREYSFEFTDRGEHRDQAQVTIKGHTLVQVHFPYTRDADGNRIYVH